MIDEPSFACDVRGCNRDHCSTCDQCGSDKSYFDQHLSQESHSPTGLARLAVMTVTPTSLARATPMFSPIDRFTKKQQCHQIYLIFTNILFDYVLLTNL